MIKITRSSPNRLDIEMSGKLDAAAMTKSLDELIEKSQGIENGKMLYEVVDYHLPSFAAIAIEFSRFPSMMRFITQFDRAALLTDKKWLKTIAELEGKIIPGLEIKAFSREQKNDAEAWLENGASLSSN